MACFSLDGDHGGKKVTVGIDWKTGIAAKDWDSVARKEKIEVNSVFLCYTLMIYAPLSQDMCLPHYYILIVFCKLYSLQGLELELKKLEEAVDTIHNNLYHLINRLIQIPLHYLCPYLGYIYSHLF